MATTPYGGADDGLAPLGSAGGGGITGSSGNAPSGYQSYQDGGPMSRAGTAPTAPGGAGTEDPNKNEEEEANVYRPGRPYKGFSTSVSSLFLHPGTVRPDCCSMACFGVLQADRTRYLLTGVPPPSPLRRVLIHIFIPLGLFLAAGWCAVHVRDATANQFLSTLLVLILIAYLISGCMRGTVKRVQVREEMLWRMREADAMRDQNGYTDGEAAEALERMGGVRALGGVPDTHLAGDGELGHHGLDLGQTRREMSCAHKFFGCYMSDLTTRSVDSEPKPIDLCGCIWRAFSELCCHRMCNCFLQFCGCCALAQEAREIERLVPVSKRRFDYVTFEPYVEYYGPIVQLREGRNRKLWDHYGALSHLSLMLVKSLALVLFVLFLLSLIGSNPNFRLNNMAVLLATLAQAFLILYFVHWKWNRFDLSLDAVVKYFACGFVLTTGLAVFFEMVETILLQMMLYVIVVLCNIGVNTNENGYQGVETVNEVSDAAQPEYGSFMPSPLPAFTPVGGHGRYLGVDDPYGYSSPSASDVENFGAASGEDYMRHFAHSNPGVVVLYLLLNAFAMAALVEELCKYFGYKMVEHPDFLTQDDLGEAAAAQLAMEEREAEEEGSEAESESDDYAPPPSVVSGQVVSGAAMPTGAIVVAGTDVPNGAAAGAQSKSSNASVLNTVLSPFARLGAEADKRQAIPRSSSRMSATSAPSTTPAIAKSSSGGAAAATATESEDIEYALPARRSLNSIGAGVTVAMVSVALGFACCENLIYIFVYNGSSVGMEISVLIARSLFPVHPLAAAIQSIGVCRRDLEGDRTRQLGRIISPAVLMHGSFDFVLMLISFLVALNSANGGGSADFAAKAEIASFTLSLAIVFCGAGYYVVESKKQKKRLDDMDAREGVMGGAREPMAQIV